MGLILSQIINKFVPVQITGSDDYYFIPITASTNEKTFSLPFTAREITLINDGTFDVQFAMNGNSANPNANLGTVYDDNTPQWTYTGTWSISTAFHNYGTQSQYSYNGTTAIFKPTGQNQALTFATVCGGSGGIAQIDVSSDGGVTWVQPSTISGITRSDGATGTALNTFDSYNSSGNIYKNVTYNFPNVGNWAMRISTTGTKNASSGDTTVFIDGGIASATPIYFGNRYMIVKSGESLSLQLQTTKVNAYTSSTTSQNCRLIARS